MLFFKKKEETKLSIEEHKPSIRDIQKQKLLDNMNAFITLIKTDNLYMYKHEHSNITDHLTIKFIKSNGKDMRNEGAEHNADCLMKLVEGRYRVKYGFSKFKNNCKEYIEELDTCLSLDFCKSENELETKRRQIINSVIDIYNAFESYLTNKNMFDLVYVGAVVFNKLREF
jgi:hypothetical protein